MTYREAFDLVLDIGTFLTSIVALFTLWEMRKQRLTTIQPDIDLCNFDYLYLYHQPKLDLFASWPYLWSSERLDPMNIQSIHSPLSAFEIKLINVGVNTAKNISYRWEYDIEQYVSAVTWLDVDTEITFTEDVTSSLGINRSGSLTFLPGLDECRAGSFFLTVGQSITLPFCESFTYLVSLWLYGKFRWLESTEDSGMNNYRTIIDEFNSLPPLSLIIKFFDLSGKEYTRRYTFSFSFAMLGKIETNLLISIFSE